MTFSVGDSVWLEDRNCRAIVASQPILSGHWGRRQVYYVTLEDGRSVVAEEGFMEAWGETRFPEPAHRPASQA